MRLGEGVSATTLSPTARLAHNNEWERGSKPSLFKHPGSYPYCYQCGKTLYDKIRWVRIPHNTHEVTRKPWQASIWDGKLYVAFCAPWGPRPGGLPYSPSYEANCQCQLVAQNIAEQFQAELEATDARTVTKSL